MVVRAYYHPTPRKYTMNGIIANTLPEMGRLGREVVKQ